MINLLPQNYKNRLAREKRFKFVVALNILFFLFLIGTIIIFFLTKVSLEEQLRAEKSIFEDSQRQDKIEEAKNLEKKIKEFNKSMSNLESYYQNYFNVSEVLQTFSSTLPSKVYINSISINKGEKKDIVGEIKAKGYCPNRESLKAFDSNLNQKNNFTDINFAQKDWTQPVDINFSIDLKIKKSFNQD